MMNRQRCHWVENASELYQSYHDEEWGVPLVDDHRMIETLILESFHTGLSWLIILKKRPAFRLAFDNFDLDKIVNYNDDKIMELLNNKDIVRHKGKILATIENAKALQAIQKEFHSFSAYLWGFTDNKIIVKRDDQMTKDELSDKIAKDMKKRGIKYMGSVTVYSYLQAVGIIDAHQTKCFKAHQ